MKLFGKLFRSRDRPKNSATAGAGYDYLWGKSTSGKRVTPRSSMQMTAVYACVRVLAESIAELPLHLYRYDGKGNRLKATDHKLYFLLHDEPNPEMTSFVFRETLMTHLLLWGNAYAQIVRNMRGEIIGLYPLMPDRMTVGRDENGELYYEYIRYGDESKSVVLGTERLSPWEVLHIPGLGFDGLVGYSPIAMARNAVGMGLAVEEFGARFFEKGASPTGALEHPHIVKDPERLRKNWQSVYGGSGNTGKVVILEEGMKYTPISIPPDQAQFLETRKFQLDEIARIYRVPPHMIGDLDRSSFSNIEQQALEFVKYTLGPWVMRWEQQISKSLLLPGEKREYFAKFNVDGLLRGDYQSRMNGYAIGINNGFLSPNDVRRLENMDLIPAELGGDKYMVNGNMCPLDMAGAAYDTLPPGDDTDG